MTENYKPELGILYTKYYEFVKKQKRDIDFEKTYTDLELHDIQYTILLLFNHISTNENQDPLQSDEIKEKILNDVHIDDAQMDAVKVDSS